MKHVIIVTLVVFNILFPIFINGQGQDSVIGPSLIITGVYHGQTPPLRDLPALTDAEWQVMTVKAEHKMLNPKLQNRSYPYAATALPKGPDPVWQRQMGTSRGTRALLLNFNGQDSPYYPPDANGTAGPNHYMQTINTVYTIYDKTGTRIAGPTAMNLLFSGVAGSGCNDGDPIVLYDEQADRWLAAEFSLCGSNDYMLIAVSTTNDPTGTWHKYSFDVADVPDYEKFGIWQDGYYMGTNNYGDYDIFVFERSQMLQGLTAQGVGFVNPWRPTTIDGFMCVPPLDNDGDFAPAGEPGLFITINDDAIGGGSDQLWIYELDVNWQTPASSTFTRTQQLNVASFDSDFGNTWNNISQQGTTQKIDAIPQVIMNPPQYRNFGSYETIVCCHTVDVDNSDHAGVRWYELRRVSSGNWTIRQQGTFAPDGHSRWMGSIMLNGKNEIALGYSISSSTLYPGIRYCGQSADAYAATTNAFDIAEVIVHTGAYSQTATNRWGDYSGMQVDPADDTTFWFTTQYIGSGGARKTKITSFNFGPEILVANFTANATTPEINTNVNLTDISLGSPTSWAWSFTPGTVVYIGGTTASSQNPQVQFTVPGPYSVQLTVSDGVDTASHNKANYITAFICSNISLPFSEDFSDGTIPGCWTIIDNLGNGQVWLFNNPGGRTVNTASASNGFAILDSDFYGSGNSQNADLVSPAFNFTDYISVILTFQHYFLSYTGSSGTLSFSTNGGSTWTTLQSWTSTTANPSTYNQDLTAQLAGQANVKLKWNYTGTYGYYWAVDDISITGTGPNQWTGATSADWGVSSNWSYGTVPAGTSPVTIPSSAANWPIYSGNLTIGSTCGNLTLKTGAHMEITGNLEISPGSSLTFTGSGELSIGGDWANSGSFVPGQGTVIFTGSNPSSVSIFTNTSDITDYVLSTFPKSMTLLPDASSGPAGNNEYGDANIGFTFNYLGTNYSAVRICTNGWISLNQSGTTSENNPDLFTVIEPNTTLAAWFDNLTVDDSGELTYKTEGNAPTRVFTVEWKNIPTFWKQANARINFQVRLFETSNIIEFHYGNLVAGTHNNSEGASIGIEDAIGGSGHFIEATTGSTTSAVTDLESEFDWPTVNYRFAPPIVTESFYNVVVSKTGSAVDFNSNAAINGSFSVMPGSSFNVKNGKTMTLAEDL
jgi:PKD repeat protein